MSAPLSALPVIDTWRLLPQEDFRTVVLPDGCRDLILRVSPDGRACWFVSELADGVSLVDARAGEVFLGYRFHPGTTFQEVSLLRAVQALGEPSLTDITAVLGEHVRIDVRLAEALASLSENPSVAAASRRLGVSERSLERLVTAATGRPPGFWKNLARVRRTAGALTDGRPLSEIAADHGYADQAHMTREFARWFGISPARFRDSPDWLARVREPGYC